MNRVFVVDYESSNIRSVAKALEKVADPRLDRIQVSARLSDLAQADRVVFPGQGAMAQCIRSMEETGLREALGRIIGQKPFLGICLGMQILLECSEEDGGVEAWGHFHGQVRRFSLEDAATGDQRIKIPQMGWNRVWQEQAHPLWNGIEDGSHFYFVHSYYVPMGDDLPVCGRTTCGIHDYAAALGGENLFATQFHPEKSQHDGLRMLRNFLRWDGADC
ncbi:MAG: imidazole glycerol phosphate synthase subunit HisH [Candidatus Eutrophobiaceae bacterium]